MGRRRKKKLKENEIKSRTTSDENFRHQITITERQKTFTLRLYVLTIPINVPPGRKKGWKIANIQVFKTRAKRNW